MKKVTFNKLGQKAICMFCRVNKVPLERYNQRCEECKTKVKSENVESGGVTVGKRMPAAVIETQDGEKIFVDKFGKEVKDHGYDLNNDPRGYNRNGRTKNKTII